MKSTTLIILTLIVTIAHAQKPKEHALIVGELIEKIETAKVSEKILRIAVVPFVPSNPAEASKAFGEYLTESITGKLAEKPQAFKVFERQRLDAIFKENELMLGGMMKPSEALKVGQLLPIDALFSGTYTKLKSYVEVSGRLIDVTSGEILTSYSGRIKMTKNIKTLFDAPAAVQTTSSTSQSAQPTNITIINQVSNNTSSPSKSKEEICKEKVKAFQSRLEDLSTEEKIKAMVTEAMKTPFDNQCGQLHYNVIYSLSRFHIYPEDYKRFLCRTIDTIAFPTNDERAYEVIRYFANDKKIDDDEWKSGFATTRKVGNYTLSSYISYLIGRVDEPGEMLQNKVNQIMTEVSAQRLGLPRPIAFNDAFFEMMEGLDKNQEMKRFFYKTYSPQLSIDSKSGPRVYSRLNALYKEESGSVEKQEILQWIIKFFNTYSFEKSHEELYDFAFSFNLTSNETTNETIRKEYPATHLKLLTAQCKDKFSAYALLSPYNSQKEDRINFCTQNNIPVAGVIPTPSEADGILKGANLDEQLRVMKLIVQMPTVPQQLESTLINLLDKRSLEDKEKMTEIQSLAVMALGQLKSSNTKAIEHMIRMTASFNYRESDRAKAALVEIGKPAVMPLVKKLQMTTEQDDGLRYQIILMLGKIGKDAKPAETTLQNLLTKTTNSDVRYVIEATLQAIR